jgi:hypothetical protein
MRRTDEASGPSLAISLAVYRLFVISLVSAAASQSEPAPGFLAMQPVWVDSVAGS